MLSLFGEANVAWIFLKEDYQVKLKYLTVAMAPSRYSVMSNLCNFLMFFDEGDGSQSGYMVRLPGILA